MRSAGWAVDRAQAEGVRRRLRSAGLLRGELVVRREGSRVIFPVRDAPPPELPGEPAPADFAEAHPARPRSYADLFEGPVGRRAELPRAYDVVGDVVLIRIPPALQDQAAAVGEALLRFVPGCRIVGDDRGVVGMERRRSIVRIAGSGSWTTRHRENGLALQVDLAQAYFSPRLAREHARVAGSVRPGERVLDLCCGVGPFSLLIARQGRAGSVVAVEANPVAVELFEANARSLGVQGKVRIVPGRVEEVGRSLSPADRVILNLPRSGAALLPHAAALTAPGGVIHYYEVTARGQADQRAQELAAGLGPDGSWRAQATGVVHEFSPRSDLVSYTVIRDSS